MKEQRTRLPDWLILAFAIAMAILTVIIVIVILHFGTVSWPKFSDSMRCTTRRDS
jgi:hypothetical protein